MWLRKKKKKKAFYNLPKAKSVWHCRPLSSLQLRGLTAWSSQFRSWVCGSQMVVSILAVFRSHLQFQSWLCSVETEEAPRWLVFCHSHGCSLMCSPGPALEHPAIEQTSRWQMFFTPCFACLPLLQFRSLQWGPQEPDSISMLSFSWLSV